MPAPSTPRDWIVRPAREDDLAALPAIEASAARRFRDAGLDGPWIDTVTPAGDFAAAMRDGRLWVAVRDGSAVGFALVVIAPPGLAMLAELDVLPGHGRIGIGRALVAEAVSWARGRGFGELALTTFRDVPWNGPWYASLGFREFAGDEVPDALREALAHEAAAGLPTGGRVAMALDLCNERNGAGTMHDLPEDSPLLLIVPGVGDSGPAHWQTWLERTRAGSRRVQQEDWNMPVRDDWVAGLAAALRDAKGPVVLVGHSAGAVTIVHWASRALRADPVVAALLVAPADLEVDLPDGTPVEFLEDAGWVPCPRSPLPFPTTVVASSDDPYARLERSRGMAAAWGSRLVELQEAGHINADAGFGEWPLALELLADLVRRAN